jgi:uridine kinase
VLKVYYNQTILNVPLHTSLETLKKQLNLNKNIYAAKVNNKLKELTFKLNAPTNQIIFLGSGDASAINIYEASLRYLVSMASYKLFENISLHLTYYSSSSILVSFPKETSFSPEMFQQIKEEIFSLVSQKLDITKKKLPLVQALQIYQSLGFGDKISLLKQKDMPFVTLYFCQNYCNYMYQGLVPNTSYLDKYHLFYHQNGFVIQFITTFSDDKINPFQKEPLFEQMLAKSSVFKKNIQIQNVFQINQFAQSAQSQFNLINLAEINHQNQLNQLSALIASRVSNLKIINISGPSASGKTTFAKRLQLQLQALGIPTFIIAMDNYYLPLKDIPKEKDGISLDFESIDALNILLFNQNIYDLLTCKKTTIPQFDFVDRSHTQKDVKIDNQIILVEGIHAINPKLTLFIQRLQKFQIYIAPQHQLSLDLHNPLHLTDIRFLRRAIRDYISRNTTILRTFEFWNSVRKGEFIWIYPNQQEADFVFNSELIYEFNVLKPYLIPLLLQIPDTNQYFDKAQYFLNLLSFFKSFDSNLVFHESLLKEFIGGSPFYF